ncbi:MAG: DedA family protein [Ignavibacteriae bacterium]|nr:DedA family protein [Ignavibacteriota bacterium]
MESIILYLQTVNPLLIYCVVFAIAYIENVFPPSPSDLVIVFAGSLIAVDRINFAETVLVSTGGSTLGFLTMYKIGDWFGDRILEQGKVKFIPASSVHKVEEWFAKYGYAIIIANRFLAGTRAVVSFFAGMSELKLMKTTVLCSLSALTWNVILLSVGYYLGENLDLVDYYLKRYSEIVTALILIILAIWGVRVYRRRRGDKQGS